LRSATAWPCSSRARGWSGSSEFEVGGGGVEEQQVDLEVEQVRDLTEHLAFELFAHVVEPVHRPVAGIVGGLG
jgi:hypothetical protein